MLIYRVKGREEEFTEKRFYKQFRMKKKGEIGKCSVIVDGEGKEIGYG